MSEAVAVALIVTSGTVLAAVVGIFVQLRSIHVLVNSESERRDAAILKLQEMNDALHDALARVKADKANERK